MKSIILILFIFSYSLFSFSQNFSDKISNNANVVFTLKGNNLLNKVSESEINKSLIFAEFTKKSFRNLEINKLSDFGLNFNKDFCFTVESDTNMVYTIMFLPIKNIKKFKTLISQKNKKLIKTKRYKMIVMGGKTEVLAWNKDFAVFVKGYYLGSKYSYTYNYEDYYEVNNAIEKVLKEVHNNNEKISVAEKAKRVDKILNDKKELDNAITEIKANDSYDTEMKEFVNELAEAMEESVEEGTMEVEEEIVEESSDYYPTYQEKNEIKDYRTEVKNKKNEARKKLRDEYENTLLTERLNDLFAKKGLTNSISKNASFKKSNDNNADGIVWMKNSGSAYGGGIASLIYGINYRRVIRELDMPMNTMYPYSSKPGVNNGEIVSKLYFEKDKVRISANGFYSSETKKAFKNVLNTKLDKKFYNYINKDEFVGYASMSFSTKGYMEEFPKLWSQAYANVLPKAADEVKVLADVLSVFLDEEAIGELVTGDMFFVVNDLKQKEISYTSYSYDDNYKRTKVEKTRKEVLPDFLFMLSTKNEKILNRIVKLGVKHEVLINSGTYYSINGKKSDLPMDLYSVIKDGMVFVTTSKREMETILNGGYKNGLGEKHKKLINNNSAVVYYNNQQLMSKIPEEEIRNGKQKKAFNYIKDNSKDIYMTVGAKNGDFNSDIILNIPEGEKNGALFLFSFLNKMLEIDKGVK